MRAFAAFLMTLSVAASANANLTGEFRFQGRTGGIDTYLFQISNAGASTLDTLASPTFTVTGGTMNAPGSSFLGGNVALFGNVVNSSSQLSADAAADLDTSWVAPGASEVVAQIEVSAGNKPVFNFGAATGLGGGASLGTIDAGDVDQDGDFDVDDIDELQLAIRSAAAADRYDIDENGLVEVADFNFLLGVLQYLPGDTMGDYDIDNDDIFLILGGAKFGIGPSNATWSQGDFNNDGSVNNDDIFLILGTAQFGAGQYLATAGPATVVVPEPATLGLLAAGGLMMLRRRR